MIKQLIICMAAIVVSIALLSSCLKPTVTIRLSDHIYEVPKGNLFSSGLSRFFEGLGTDKKTPEMHLIFSAEEMEKNVPGFSVSIPGYREYYADDLTVLVADLTSENVDRINTGEFHKDLWLGRGRYSPEQLGPQIVEFDEETQLYRVSMEQIKKSWAFTNIDPRTISPEDALPHTNSVVAFCSDRETLDGLEYSCTSGYLRRDVDIEFRTGRTNFKHYQKIIDFVYAKLEEWEIENKGSE